MKVGSLFSGIGGIEIGLSAAGVGRVVWQVEKDPFCRAVLEKHWPDVRRYEDVCAVGARDLEPVEVIAGGFPCQDVSVAGLGAGLKGARSGLWFEYARIVEEVMPRFVVVENVAALVRRGLDEVLRSLAALGYDAEWSVLRATDVGRILGDDRYGARHRRERLFLIAWKREGFASMEKLGDAYRAGRKRSEQHRAMPSVTNNNDPQPVRLDFTGRTVGVLDRVGHGLLPRLDVARPGEEQRAWEAPRTVVEQQDRAKRLRALGNAVVPAAAYVVGLRLLQIQQALDEGREP